MTGEKDNTFTSVDDKIWNVINELRKKKQTYAMCKSIARKRGEEEEIRHFEALEHAYRDAERILIEEFQVRFHK